MKLAEIREIAESLARQAGAVLREGVDRATVIARKSTTVDVLTEYDERCEKLIRDGLAERLPDHQVIGEETLVGRVDYERPVWFVDPLDGTVNFAHGLPIFSVSLGLYEAGEAKVGVVYDPMRDEMFGATRGGGAWLSDARGRRQRLSVGRTEALNEALIATGFPYDRQTHVERYLPPFGAMIRQARDVRRCGSAALDLCYVAAGRFDGFWEYGLHPWDVAAGALIIEEAGGVTTDHQGRPLDIKPGRLDVLTANRALHAAVGAVLRANRGG